LQHLALSLQLEFVAGGAAGRPGHCGSILLGTIGRTTPEVTSYGYTGRMIPLGGGA
jgi:hypothetical protein